MSFDIARGALLRAGGAVRIDNEDAIAPPEPYFISLAPVVGLCRPENPCVLVPVAIGAFNPIDVYA